MPKVETQTKILHGHMTCCKIEEERIERKTGTSKLSAEIWPDWKNRDVRQKRWNARSAEHHSNCQSLQDKISWAKKEGMRA